MRGKLACTTWEGYLEWEDANPDIGIILCASTLRNIELRTAASISAIRLGDGANSRGTVRRKEMTHRGPDLIAGIAGVLMFTGARFAPPHGLGWNST
jgi:hypothetical protein